MSGKTEFYLQNLWHTIFNYFDFIGYRSESAVERTGGFRSILACQRALQEAMQGLFHGA